MDMIISFFRDTLSGTEYIIYATICLTLMFAIVGYLFKQKYGKAEFVIKSTSTDDKKTIDVPTDIQTKKEKGKKEKKKKKDKKSSVQTNDKVLASMGLESKNTIAATNQVKPQAPVQPTTPPPIPNDISQTVQTQPQANNGFGTLPPIPDLVKQTQSQNQNK